MTVTLDQFTQPANSSGISNGSPAREESVPLDATRPVIRNFPLVWLMKNEAFAKDPRVRLILTSNGNEDTGIATEYYLRRVVS